MIGPATEKLLADVFSQGALATAGRAASALGLDEKTFGALVEAGAIKAVLIGEKTKRYTEADLRAFLMGETKRSEIPCQSTNRRKAGSGSTTSSTKVIGFTEARARRRAAARLK